MVDVRAFETCQSYVDLHHLSAARITLGIEDEDIGSKAPVLNPMKSPAAELIGTSYSPHQLYERYSRRLHAERAKLLSMDTILAADAISRTASCQSADRPNRPFVWCFFVAAFGAPPFLESCQMRGRSPAHRAATASSFESGARARRSVIRVSSDGRPSRSAKPGHSAVPLLT